MRLGSFNLGIEFSRSRRQVLRSWLYWRGWAILELALVPLYMGRPR